MKISLKCGEYYDFHNIKSVIFYEYEKVVINGNMGKGKRYKNITILLEQFDPKSYDDLVKYCKKYLDFFAFEGFCPQCNSDKITLFERCISKRDLNDRKGKREITRSKPALYKCEKCGSKYKKKSELLELDVVEYYK